jgi:hypothetical protein
VRPNFRLLRQREQQQEKTMTEFTMRAFAKSGSSWDGDVHRAPVIGLDSKRELDRRLDQALEDTFPASDPVSIVMSVRNG